MCVCVHSVLVMWSGVIMFYTVSNLHKAHSVIMGVCIFCSTHLFSIYRGDVYINIYIWDMELISNRQLNIPLLHFSASSSFSSSLPVSPPLSPLFLSIPSLLLFSPSNGNKPVSGRRGSSMGCTPSTWSQAHPGCLFLGPGYGSSEDWLVAEQLLGPAWLLQNYSFVWETDTWGGISFWPALKNMFFFFMWPYGLRCT